MSHQRYEQLVQLSVKYNFLIIADEVYHLVDYEKENHLKSFATYHTEGTVIALFFHLLYVWVLHMQVMNTLLQSYIVVVVV
jgi:hypothetical protein